MYSHEHDRAVINRLSRCIGHMNAVKTMVEEGRDCSDILIQLSAIKSKIANASKLILKEHIQHCLVHAVQENDQETLQNLMAAIDKIV